MIGTFGSPGKYYAATKIYLASPDGRFRWWTEDQHFTDATLVNRATTDRCYGIQNAPTTVTGMKTTYDEVATTWDLEHPVGVGEADHVERLLSRTRGKYPPYVLDLGCGTGRILDLGLVTADRCAAVDSSQAMLNMLLRKHPKVAAVYAADIRDLLKAETFTPGQFDWVFLDGNVELDAIQRVQIEQIARLALIAVNGESWEVLDVTETAKKRTLAFADEMRVLS